MRINRDQLLELDKTLTSKGYKKMAGHYKSEDYAYWKTFKNGEVKQYQLAIMIYDFSDKEQDRYDTIGVQYEFSLLSEKYERIDLTIMSEEMEVEEFEKYCQSFYKKMYVEYFK